MDDNNTSASNARPMTGGKQWSMHAYGVAIDINPPQNPYPSFDDDEGVAHVLSAKAAKTSVNCMDCRPNKPGRLGRAEEVVDIFANNGFLSWGVIGTFRLTTNTLKSARVAL